MMRSCLKAIFCHWFLNPLQLFALLAGMAIATALWSGVQAINSEARASYDAAAGMLKDGQFDQLVPKQGNSISQDTYIQLRLSGWLVSPIIEGKLANVQLIGIDGFTAPEGLGTPLIDYMNLNSGIENSSFLIANQETARLLQDKFKVLVDPVIAPGMALGDVSIVQELLNRNDLNRLIISPEQPLGRPELSEVSQQLRVKSALQRTDMTQLTESFHLNLTAFGLLSFTVGFFIVYSTIGLAFEQRRAMIRTLRSLGVPLRFLTAVMVVEMLVLTLLGATIGIVLGYIIAALLLPDVAATLSGLYGARISGNLELRTEWWLSGFLICLLGSSVAFTGRIWKIWQMPILVGMAPRAWAIASANSTRKLGLLAVLLLSSAVLMAIWGGGLVVAFALVACLLIGAALALPVFLVLVLSIFQKKSISPIWSWFWADTRHQLPGLGMALMALLLAVSANIGVSTMVSSFRLTFTGFLDQRLAPELFIEVDNADKSAELGTYLLKQNLEVLPLLATSWQVYEHPVRMFGIRVSPTYRNNWIFLDATPNVWERVQLGVAVVINEQLARRTNLWAGDTLEIAPDFSMAIAAVVGDYGNPKGQIIISEEKFLDLQPDVYASQFGVRTEDAATLKNQIMLDLGLSSKTMIDQAALKKMSMEVFDRTFTVTRALNVLTLGVAGFALLMSLLTLADLRIPQLAPVWALGLTRRQIGGLELLRSLVFSSLVFVCALPLGLTLAWVLLSVVNVEAFGWKLPMYVFPSDFVKLIGYATLANLLASAWPSLKLMRTPPSQLLKVFANER